MGIIKKRLEELEKANNYNRYPKTIMKPYIEEKLINKDYTISYEHAIQLGLEENAGEKNKIKYVWATNRQKEQYLKGIILMQFDGLMFKVMHE